MKDAAARPRSAPGGVEPEARPQLQTVWLLAAIAGGLVLCCLLVAPFFAALAWAVTLAVLFAPLQGRLETRLKSPTLAAACAVSAIFFLIAVPGIFVGQRLFLEAAKGAKSVGEAYNSGLWRQALEGHPGIAAAFADLEQHIDLPGAVQALAAWLSGAAGALVRSSFYQALGFCLVFYILFFLLRDRSSTLRAVRSYLPLTPPELDRLFRRIGDTIHATVYGTLAVAAVQGLLGGLMFWWLGLPAPLLWGVVMGLLAVIPVLGAFVVWVPAAALLVLEGKWGLALILSGWCLLVVGMIDNLLYPILVGNRLKMPTLLAFFSVVGGLLLFGAVGFVVGPVVLTVTGTLLEIRARRNEGELPGLDLAVR